ncbi:hypothetical protein V2J09_023585 [Rumex salicifolius]
MDFHAENGRLPPGIRFHPTDEELLMHYLKRKLLGKRLEPELVAEVEIYQFHPADLKEMACLKKDLNWYFFCSRGRKYGSGDRTNRATQTGYWKATGKDRAVLYRGRTVGKVKTLVFHLGKPPKGERTDWVMHEYRLEDAELANKGVPDAYVLCKIFKKGGWGPRNGEQYGAPYNEEEWNMEEEENITSDRSTMLVIAEDQNASEVTNPAMTMDLVSPSEQIYSCDVTLPGLVSPPEQIYSCDVSLSGVDQASTTTSMSDAAANVASTSKEAIAHHGQAVELTPDSIPKAALLNSVPNNVDDMWCVDDFIGLYDNLGDVPDCADGMWPASKFRGNCDNFEDPEDNQTLQT